MSRERKFTPGPWAVNPVVARVDEMPSKIPVCKMLWPTEDRSEAETEANANLISSAPELLEALVLCEELIRINIEHQKTRKESLAGRMARNAIAKALGESK